MDINTLLTELVVIADNLDSTFPDITADIDAAIFIMSDNNALPRNKSFASVVKENYEKTKSQTAQDLETQSIGAATRISNLISETLEQKNHAAIAAILGSLVQSLDSILHPNQVLSTEASKKGSEFLVVAEKKLAQREELHNSGYRIGLVRSKIEKA